MRACVLGCSWVFLGVLVLMNGLSCSLADVEHVKQCNAAEAEFWRRNQGITDVGPSDQVLLKISSQNSTDTDTDTHTHIQTQTHTHTHTHTGCDHGVASILWLDVEVTGHNEREFLCSGATPVHQLLRVHGHHVGLSKLAWHVVCCHRKRLFCQRGKFGLGCRPEGKVSNRSAGGKQGAGAKHKE